MSDRGGIRPEGSGVIGSPDGSQTIAGDQGAEVLQEGSQLVVKTGVSGNQRDYDIESVNITDDTIEVAAPDNIGTTAELSGALESDGGELFDIEVEWLADDGTTLYTETFGSDTDIVLAAVTVKSDYVAVNVTDQSSGGTSNSVTGTLNFH
jgi:hypothetical protein